MKEAKIVKAKLGDPSRRLMAVAVAVAVAVAKVKVKVKGEVKMEKRKKRRENKKSDGTIKRTWRWKQW